MANESNRDSAVLNLRVSRSKLATFKNLSRALNVSVNSVVNSFLMWADFEPERQLHWLQDVQDLRQIVKGLDFENPSFLDEITVDDFHQRRELCMRLQEIGFIDGFKAIVSKNDPNRMICTYRLTTSGLVIASSLEQRLGGVESPQLDFEAEPQHATTPVAQGANVA